MTLSVGEVRTVQHIEYTKTRSHILQQHDGRLVIHFKNTISGNKINTNCINHLSPFLHKLKSRRKSKDGLCMSRP
jgi:hypothetical protein